MIALLVSTVLFQIAFFAWYESRRRVYHRMLLTKLEELNKAVEEHLQLLDMENL